MSTTEKPFVRPEEPYDDAGCAPSAFIEPAKKKRSVLTFDQRVERILTPQRNAHDRAQKKVDKIRAELADAERELAQAKGDLDKAKRFAGSDAEAAQ